MKTSDNIIFSSDASDAFINMFSEFSMLLDKRMKEQGDNQEAVTTAINTLINCLTKICIYRCGDTLTSRKVAVNVLDNFMTAFLMNIEHRDDNEKVH
jgi:hypothetical protein